MRRAEAALAGLTLALSLASYGDAAEVSLSGEVVDMHCYLTRGERGPGHAGCANACIGRGVTPGLIADDGRVYLLLAERPVSVKDAVAGLAGEPVVARGVVVERDGLRALQLKTVERAASR
jgi:hypothetical protein